MTNEVRPQGVSDSDWQFYLRFRRHQEEEDRKRAAQSSGRDKSIQFEYVKGASEAAAEAVLGK